MTLCFVDYEPVYTLPRFIDKDVRNVDCKIPPDLMAGPLIKMGLASREPLEIKGARVVPREVLLALIPQPADISDDFATRPDVCTCYLAEVKGERSGERLIHTLYRLASARKNLGRFGDRWADVSIPVVVTALMLANGEVRSGVLPPEGLPTHSFLARLAEWGMTFQEAVKNLAN